MNTILDRLHLLSVQILQRFISDQLLPGFMSEADVSFMHFIQKGKRLLQILVQLIRIYKGVLAIKYIITYMALFCQLALCISFAGRIGYGSEAPAEPGFVIRGQWK